MKNRPGLAHFLKKITIVTHKYLICSRAMTIFCFAWQERYQKVRPFTIKSFAYICTTLAFCFKYHGPFRTLSLLS